MPVKLTVGVSRKLGLPGYSSVGASCNLEVELDAGLLQGDLDAFHARVRDAYIACQQAVYDELARLQSQHPMPVSAHGAAVNGHGQYAPSENGRGNSNGTGARSSGAPRPALRSATASQVKLICAIARSHDTNLEGLLQHEYGVEHPEELSLPQASALIDRLRALSSA